MSVREENIGTLWQQFLFFTRSDDDFTNPDLCTATKKERMCKKKSMQ